jgi:hypothetical protein
VGLLKYDLMKIELLINEDHLDMLMFLRRIVELMEKELLIDCVMLDLTLVIILLILYICSKYILYKFLIFN